MTRELTIEYADEVLSALNMSAERFSAELKLLAAIKLYEMGRLSSGAAAALAGIPKPLFLSTLSNYAVDTFRLTEHELRQDLTCVQRHM